jgi:hypothetical protein
MRTAIHPFMIFLYVVTLVFIYFLFLVKIPYKYPEQNNQPIFICGNALFEMRQLEGLSPDSVEQFYAARQLFQTQCTSCHMLYNNLIGPAAQNFITGKKELSFQIRMQKKLDAVCRKHRKNKRGFYYKIHKELNASQVYFLSRYIAAG